jgi:small-conductance mechanosensitive channel
MTQDPRDLLPGSQADSAIQGPLPPDSSVAAGELDAMGQGISGWIYATTGLAPSTQLKIILSAVAIAGVYGIRKLVMRVVEARVEDPKLLYQWSKTSAYLAFIVSFIMVGTVWVEGIRHLGTFLGLLSAGLAIALKDLVSSFAGWVFILWRRPLELGDRIQIGSDAGDVVDIRIFQFTILEIGNWVDADQSTGRIIHVPNSRLFTEPLANFTSQFEFIWHEVPVLVTFESDWRRAKALLEEVVQKVAGETVQEARQAMRAVSRKFLIHFRHLTPIVYTQFQDSGVLLTMRFLCRVRQRRGFNQAIWEAVLAAFSREDSIDFAYPTTRMYHNVLEGKTQARADLPDGLIPPKDSGP